MIDFISFESIYIDWHPHRKDCVLKDTTDMNVDASCTQPLYERLMRIDLCNLS